MKSICAFLVLVLCSIYVNAQESDVVVLTNGNFDELTKQGDWLLEFYAPWCGHCKRLEPIYNELATAVKGKFNVGKVDCTVQTDLQSRFAVRGYPTIKFYKDGQLYDFSGERSVAGFTTYMEGGYKTFPSKPFPAPGSAPAPAQAQASAPAPAPGAGKDTIVLGEDSLHSRIAKGDWLVKFYAPWCGHCKRLAPIWDEAATALKGTSNIAKVDCSVHKGLCDEFNIRGYPTLLHFKDGEMREYNNERSVTAFKEFLKDGYKTVKAQVIPAPASAIKKQFASALISLEGLLQGNVWLILGASAAIGVGLGLLVICLVPSGAPAPAKPVKSTKKAAAEAEIEEEEEEEEEKDDDSKKDD